MTYGKSLVFAAALALVPVGASAAPPVVMPAATLIAPQPHGVTDVTLKRAHIRHGRSVSANHKAWFAKAIARILEGQS